MKIPIARTSLTETEMRSVLKPMRSGWLVQGEHVKEFESKWSAFTGAKHSIAVTSCTSAMHLSLAALDFGPGDEAIVPAFTWISTANVVEHLRGKVVFCDIDLSTFNLAAEQIESVISKSTKALMPVHLFGLAAAMETICQVAAESNLSIVEDAACGFGATYNGRHVGTFGDTGCFSFHPRKAITTGEGGMVTTGDDRIADRIRRLRDHGASITDLERHKGPRPYLLADHPEAGYNQRMTDIQGALGSAQMDRAKAILKERQFLASNYDQAFSDLDWLRTPPRLNGYTHGYQSYPCLFQTEPLQSGSVTRIHEARNSFMDRLQQEGVSTRPATHAVHMLSYYRKKYGLDPRSFPNAYAASQCSISFPLFSGMSETEQAYVIEKVRELQP
jgi:perosamine synthetase